MTTGRLRPYSAIDDLQQKAIDALYENNERLALLETGFGKTLVGDLLEACELAEIALCRQSIRGVGRFFGRERAEIHLMPADADLGAPAVAVGYRVGPLETCSSLAGVPAVLALGSPAQIPDPVVAGIAVFMVNDVVGVEAIVDRPRQSMSLVIPPVEHHDDIPALKRVTRNVTGLDFRTRWVDPDKLPRLRIVGEKRPDVLHVDRICLHG